MRGSIEAHNHEHKRTHTHTQKSDSAYRNHAGPSAYFGGDRNAESMKTPNRWKWRHTKTVKRSYSPECLFSLILSHLKIKRSVNDETDSNIEQWGLRKWARGGIKHNGCVLSLDIWITGAQAARATEQQNGQTKSGNKFTELMIA